jgi:hypothetical protein
VSDGGRLCDELMLGRNGRQQTGAGEGGNERERRQRGSNREQTKNISEGWE